METFWASETVTWKIYADTEEDAMRIWQEYVDGEAPNMDCMKLVGVDYEGTWND